MHPALLAEVVKTCRHNVASDTPADVNLESLEGAVVQLADDLAQMRTELGRAYRCIQGMHSALHKNPASFPEGYHAPTIGAAKRFVFEDALDGSEYFIGKPVDLLHAALRLPDQG